MFVGCSIIYWFFAVLLSLSLGAFGDCAPGDTTCEVAGRNNLFLGTLGVFAVAYLAALMVRYIKMNLPPR